MEFRTKKEAVDYVNSFVIGRHTISVANGVYFVSSIFRDPMTGWAYRFQIVDKT